MSAALAFWNMKVHSKLIKSFGLRLGKAKVACWEYYEGIWQGLISDRQGGKWAVVDRLQEAA